MLCCKSILIFSGIKTGVERIILTLENREFKKTAYPILSLLTLIVAEYLCLGLNLYKSHTLYIVVLNGLYFGYMTSKLILCTMAKKPSETFSYDNLVYLIAIIVALLSNCFWMEVVVLSVCASFLIFRYVNFMLNVTNQLLRYLNINF